jgi:IclR family transcriptional regulator, pca regulon regulatory protein
VAGRGWQASHLDQPRYSLALERGLAILECFSAERPLLGNGEIADELSMSRSTTHRYISTLVALGYLEQGARRKYRLTLKVTDLGMSAMNATGLREHAHPYLLELCQRTNHTTSIGVLDGGEVLFIDRVHSVRHTRPIADLSVGSRAPTYACSIGKVLLAHLSDEEREEVLGGLKFSLVGANTIPDRYALETEFEQIELAQFAVEDEELVAGVRSIAAPVRDLTGEVVAAMTIEAPSSAMSLEHLAGVYGAHLVTAADQVSARLGYRREDEAARQSAPVLRVITA